MAVNSAGFQVIFDGGNPRSISGKAVSGLSAGMLVYIDSASDAVSSGLNSFTTADLLVTPEASGLKFTGVAMESVSSGATVSVLTRGVILARAYDTVTAGQTQVCEGTDAIADGTTAGHVIGRALTTATSGNYAMFYVNQ